MSLSVCVRNVKAISQGGNVTQGDMTCENIDILKSAGYTIEYLDGKPEPDSTASSFEPIQEPIIQEIIEEPIIEEPIIELPIETEIIQVVKPIYAIYQEDIFDHSLVLAEEITQVKANNIELKNVNNNLESEIENSITKQEFNEYKLNFEISRVHSVIASNYASWERGEFVGGLGSPSGKASAFTTWNNSTESSEINLENFASNLGLVYNRRKSVNNQPMYYKSHIPDWTFEKWEQLP
jgi:hypothetical protein